MADSNQHIVMPWLMTTNAEARFVKLEERVESQGRTLSHIDGTMDKIAGAIEKIAVQAEKIDHISGSVDEVKKSLADQGGRLMVAERDIETLKSHISYLKDDVDELKENLEEAERDVERHRPIIATMKWVGTTLGASIIGLIWAIITGKVQITWGG